MRQVRSSSRWVSTLGVSAAVALALVAAPATAGRLCPYPSKPCGNICIAKHKVCPRCRKDEWLCNGHCIPKRMACLLN